MSFVTFVNNFLKPGFRSFNHNSGISFNTNFDSHNAAKPFLNIHDPEVTAKKIFQDLSYEEQLKTQESATFVSQNQNEIQHLIKYLKEIAKALENLPKLAGWLLLQNPNNTNQHKKAVKPKKGFLGFWNRDKCSELVTDMRDHHVGWDFP